MYFIAMSSEEEIRYEITRSLKEWSVDPTTEFYHKTIKTALASFKFCRDDENNQLSHESDTHDFPRDSREAIKYVFLDALKGKKKVYYTYSDKLDESFGSFAPYFSFPNKKDSRYSAHQKFPPLCYKKRLELGHYKQQDLDPLNRFKFRTIDASEYYYLNVVDKGFVLGTAFEAIVSNYAVHKVACHNCKMKCLRWNGGPSSAWKDLMCIECDSIYEIKSKESPEAIEKCFTHNSFNGGSFEWYPRSMNANQKCNKDRKKYLVIVSRSPIFLSTNVWPVHIVEIDTVLPRLGPMTFNAQNNTKVMKTSIRTKKNSKEFWFKVSYEPYDFNLIAKEVYNELYPGKWEQFQNPLTTVSEKEEKNKVESPIDPKDLIKKLDALKVGDSNDDWETCYLSEEDET